MNQQTRIMLIVAVCGSVLLIGAIRKHWEWLLNLIFRTVTETLAIFLSNLFLGICGMESSIGLNAVTVLTTAILGFPGLFLLYGIHFYKVM